MFCLHNICGERSSLIVCVVEGFGMVGNVFTQMIRSIDFSVTFTEYISNLWYHFYFSRRYQLGS